MIHPSLLWLCLLLFADGATISVFTTPLLLRFGHTAPPLLVAALGGLASALGSAVQLVLLRWALASQHPFMRRFAPSRERVDRVLQAHPSASFLALLIARATPLPDAPLKLVAAAVSYPISRYALAVLLGSLPYYFALAWLGSEFKFPDWLIAAAAGLLLLGWCFDFLRRRSRTS
ncbi:MAG: VTT domain-containing protein [Candidatus Eiseniibacteriota bacterium]